MQVVESVLHSIPDPKNFLVAFSGGRDSHVLLWIMARLRERHAMPLSAVHVHHGLQSAADIWSAHCEGVCRDLDIPIEVIEVDATPVSGQSPEDAARRARYAVLDERIFEGGVLLTAHHQDDQAETVLLQLLRGSGPEGLAAMPECSPFGHGVLVRPLLDVSRAEIEVCARRLGLQWVEDPSNDDRAFDRNRLRHDVVPLIKGHWPAFSQTLARSARHCAEAAELLRETAEGDLAACIVSDMPDVLSIAVLSIEALNALSAARQAQVLRLWVKNRGLPMPASAHIDQIRSSALAADLAVHSPQVSWSNAVVRAWRGRLYLGDKAVLGDWAPDDAATLVWAGGSRELALPGGGILKRIDVFGDGLRRSCLDQGLVTVGFRQGGERCQLPGETHHRRLKQLLQDSGIPPWQRARLPLIYIDGVLAAIADRWVCAPFAAGGGEEGVRFEYGTGYKIQGGPGYKIQDTRYKGPS